MEENTLDKKKGGLAKQSSFHPLFLIAFNNSNFGRIIIHIASFTLMV
jgi:hypothetical protein